MLIGNREIFGLLNHFGLFVKYLHPFYGVIARKIIQPQYIKARCNIFSLGDNGFLKNPIITKHL